MSSCNLRGPLVTLGAAFAFGVPCFAAAASEPIDLSTRASATSGLAASVATGVLVAGTLGTLQLSGHAVVASVQTVAEGTVIVLEGASDAGSATVRVAGHASVAVGTAVSVVAMSTGCALMAAGRMIAFVPNEIGRTLIHQSRTTAARIDASTVR